MPELPITYKPQSTELRSERDDVVVGITDRIYEIAPPTVTFDEVTVKGDLSGILEYNGRRLRIVHIDTLIGLLVNGRGARGPVWKGVRCEVLG